MKKQRPLCQALPNLSPVVPLLVWLSFTEIQLGKNSICGPDATSEVTRKNSRESAGPLGEKRKSRHTGEAAPANIPTFTDIFFLDPRENCHVAEEPEASQEKTRWNPSRCRLSSYSAEAATQDVFKHK